jgi:hypothetical protein
MREKECCKRCWIDNGGGRGFCQFPDCPCHKEKATWKSECCGAPFFVSKSTRKGTRRLCNACGKEYPKTEVTDEYHANLIKRVGSELYPEHKTEGWEAQFIKLMTFHGFEGDKFPVYPGYPALKWLIADLILKAKEEGYIQGHEEDIIFHRGSYDAGKDEERQRILAALPEMKYGSVFDLYKEIRIAQIEEGGKSELDYGAGFNAAIDTIRTAIEQPETNPDSK